MKKLISFIVPCYNSESYMDRCIESLLIVGDDCEIIIVNDGSKDKTAEIANNYQNQYPQIVKAIHKENGGHGSAINTGLKNAEGLYFKVVDSDDWLDKDGLSKLIENMKKFEKQNSSVDLVIANYIYDHLYENKKKVIRYTNIFKTNTIENWNEIGHIKSSQYFIMHSLYYKTDILKKCKIELPEHTFYVDNLVAYQPLPFVKNVCYFDLNVYHYFIGRQDQSVNEDVMKSRVDQQIRVTKLIIDSVNLNEVKKETKKLYKYLIKYLGMMIAISDVLLLMIGNKESLKKRDELWNYMKEKDENLYKELKYNIIPRGSYLNTKVGNFITLRIYKIAKRIFKFN